MPLPVLFYFTYLTQYFYFVDNSLVSRVYFFSFAVFTEDNCRLANPPYADFSIRSSLKVTGSNGLDMNMTLDTMNFILLGSLNTYLK